MKTFTIKEEIIYNSGEREYDIRDMSESHIMNVLGKFEVQRMLFVRLNDSCLEENKRKKFFKARIKELDKTINHFIKELKRRN